MKRHTLSLYTFALGVLLAANILAIDSFPEDGEQFLTMLYLRRAPLLVDMTLPDKF